MESRHRPNKEKIKPAHIAKAGSLDHIQSVIIIFSYLFIYQMITSGLRWSISSSTLWSGALAFAISTLMIIWSTLKEMKLSEN